MNNPFSAIPAFILQEIKPLMDRIVELEKRITELEERVKK